MILSKIRSCIFNIKPLNDLDIKYIIKNGFKTKEHIPGYIKNHGKFRVYIRNFDGVWSVHFDIVDCDGKIDKNKSVSFDELVNVIGECGLFTMITII